MTPTGGYPTRGGPGAASPREHNYMPHARWLPTTIETHAFMEDFPLNGGRRRALSGALLKGRYRRPLEGFSLLGG